MRRLTGPENAERLTALECGLVGNVVTEINLAVGDLADDLRRDPALLAQLKAGTGLGAATGRDGAVAWDAFCWC